MELEGVVHNGVVVPNNATALPEGTQVQIIVVPAEKPTAFGERYAQFKGAVPGLPEDMAQDAAPKETIKDLPRWEGLILGRLTREEIYDSDV